jgi:methionyl aminopeptidase
VEKVAKEAKLGVVREYVGHGCGVRLHEPPEIPNFVSRNRGPELVPGMVLAIEPMFNLGSHRVITESDNWTVRTVDGKISAHFEHMALVTEKEPEILTWPKM